MRVQKISHPMGVVSIDVTGLLVGIGPAVGTLDQGWVAMLAGTEVALAHNPRPI